MGLLLVCIIAQMILFLPSVGFATEEYAKQTRQPCATCHINPSGGGELNAAGNAFSAVIHAQLDGSKPSVFFRVVRLTVGYLHILTAILWFGTILYVHLVLKPAYAIGGLPRGEVRVGIISMVFMGATGTILTYFRITNLDILLHTRFGILLLVKICLYLIMVSSALVVVTIIGPRLKGRRNEASLSTAKGDLTPEELAAFDGKEGRPAYVAVGGTVYDATENPEWQEGLHMGRHNAGADLTEALKQAPHGEENLEALTQVGKLISTRAPRTPLPERVFMFMAYLNLTIVFSIVLILALWRWW